MNAVLDNRGRLVTVFPERAWAGGFERTLHSDWRNRLIDILRADVSIDRAVLHGGGRVIWRRAGLLHAAQEDFAAGGQVLFDCSGFDVSGCERLGLRVDAEFSRVAVIVDAVGTIGTEEVGWRVGCVGTVRVPVGIEG